MEDLQLEVTDRAVERFKEHLQTNTDEPQSIRVKIAGFG